MRRNGREGWLFALRVPAFIWVLALAACPEPEPLIDVRLWHMAQCIECIDGELAAVVEMRDSAIPGLRFFLLHGPPDTTLLTRKTALSGPFRVGAPSGASARGGRAGGWTSVVVPPVAVVERRLDDFTAVYRMRSAIALGLIGNNSARRVLCEGKAAQFRPDVQRMIDSALFLLNGTCP